MRARVLGALVLSGSLALTACSDSTQAGASPSTTDTTGAAATTCTVPARLLDQDVEQLPLTTKHVALTFDGGAGNQGVKPILDVLAAQNVRATFFLTGEFARSFPVKTARIGREHLVGNHSMTHPDFTTLTNAEIRTEVRTAERVIRRRAGQDPRRFFRFPLGARNARTIDVLNNLCYVPFRWTVDTLGWKGTSDGQSVDSVVARVMAAARPGMIVLMHVGAHPRDGSTLDADALPEIVQRLRADGYTLVRLSRILGPAP